MKIDLNVIFNDIQNSFDKEITIDKNIKLVAKEIEDINNGLKTGVYTPDEIESLKRVLKYLHSNIIEVKKQNIALSSYTDKFSEINSFVEQTAKAMEDYKLNINPYGYTQEEVNNLNTLIEELHSMYIDNIRKGIFTASTDGDKLNNAAYAISDLDSIINDYNNGINSKKYTNDQIDRLVSLREKLDSFSKNYTSTTKTTTGSTKAVPSNLFDNLNNIEKNFVDSIFNRDLSGIIENDAKFNEELNKIRIEYSSVQSVQTKLVQLKEDHELSYAFFNNNIQSDTDVKVLIDDVELTVSSISELLSKEKKSGKDYEKLSTLLNEFNEKYISCKSYILSSDDSNNKFYLSRLENYKFRCDAAKKEIDKQQKHSVIDKRRAKFKFFALPLSLATGIVKDSFITAFPEAKGLNSKISKFNLNDYAFKHLKFLEYEEDYSKTQQGQNYWKSYSDLTFFEKADKIAVDFNVMERLIKPFKTGFDFVQGSSENLINNAIGGKKR